MRLHMDNDFWPSNFEILDFSLKFEEIILDILPDCCFLLIGILVYLHYRRQPIYINDGPLLVLKTIVAAVLVGLEVASLGLRSASKAFRTNTTFAAAALDVVAACSLLAVLIVEHRHAIRASAFIGLYLVLSIFIDAIEARSYFLRDITALGAISVASSAVRLTLLALDEVPKLNLIIDPVIRTASGLEATSGFWSRTFFTFMGPVFRIGFKRTIVLKDLSAIGIEFSSNRLFADISRNWRPTEKMGTYSLMLACFSTWKAPFYATLLPRLLLTGFNYSQPYVLQAVVNAVGPHRPVSDGNILSNQDRLDPYLVVATLAVFVGSGLCRGVSTHMRYRLVIRIRGGLISLAMDKSQRLNVLDAQKNTPISLMSAEIGGIADALPECIEMPFILFESGLGIYLLWRFIQRSGFVIIFPLVFATGVSMIWGHLSGPAMRVWNQHIETRVSKTSRLLSQLPGIKMLGLGPKVAEYIQNLRVLEIATSKKFRSIRSGAIASASFCDLITPTTVIAAALFWGGFGGRFTADIVYPVLALVSHLQEPLAQLFRVIPDAKTLVVYFSRVQEFLCQAEHEDPRTVIQRSPDQSSPTSSLVRFERATVAPRRSETAVLKDINLDISPDSTTVVLGPTGSGKSTFIDSILGETDLQSGRVFCEDIAIAYCGQTVYLPNTTVQECIVGHCEYVESWFNTVVDGCQLSEDLRRLPGGKDYVVGPGGMALSGGQRVRVSIARAVFCLAQLVVLDDSLSSLDGPTGRALLEALLGEGGLFRQNRAAVVISSNMIGCVDYADQYVVLEDEGNVCVSTPQTDPDIRSRLEWLFRPEDAATSNSQSSDTVDGDQTLSEKTTKSGLQEVGDELRQKGSLSLYSFWLKFAGGVTFSVWLSLITLTGLTDGSPKIVLIFWVAEAVYVKRYFITYCLLPFVAAGLCFLSLLILFRVLGPRAAQGLHAELTNTVFNASLGILSAANTGSIMNLYSLDMLLVAKMIPTHTHNTFYLSSAGLLQLGIVLAGAVYLLAAIPFIGFVMFYLQRYYLRTSRQLRHLDLETQAPLVSSIQDMSRGLVYIRSYGWQAQTMQRNFRLLDDAQKPVYMLYCAQVFLALVLDLLAAILALVLAALAVSLKHNVSENTVGVSFLNLIAISQCLNGIIVSWTHLETSIGALSRLQNFSRNTPKERDGDRDLPSNWPSEGKIEVNIKTAGYDTGIDTPQRPHVLEDVSFSVQPGTKVGIIGRSGSGKTSLLLSLLGFLEYKGSIKIDGVEIRDTRRDELRSRIVTIAQDNLVLDGTIRQNLLPFDTELGEQALDPMTEKRSAGAAEKDAILREVLVRLRIWESLEECGELNAIVDKVGYSHGELQMLCIARAVVHRRLTGSRLVLVDEGTSNVDRWRDVLVRKTMKQYFSDCTIFVIAHRDETIADANTTITLAGGKVIRRK
ncbi:hypothetical protein NLG97_g1286 [Lecanicillium saksenae]|uniref:Uncharacterized protein n=1 Tax=Lecanicillium saksenae TaxID=468837 RepID=A0ACC1R4C3_9HYPO|nr:hypothetical protein NLG97_g1286 [Lecanicillium saksenae]